MYVSKVGLYVVQSSDYVWLFVECHGLQLARHPCPPHLPVCPSSCPLSWWCHPTILSSVALFCLQSFPASGSFPMSWLFASGGQSIGASALPSVLPMNIQGWFPSGLTGLLSLLSKELSSVFSSITVQNNQFFGAQPVQLWHARLTWDSPYLISRLKF